MGIVPPVTSRHYAIMTDTIRCPFCMADQTRPAATKAEDKIRCIDCSRYFDLSAAIPASSSGGLGPASSVAINPPSLNFFWFGTAVMVLAAGFFTWAFHARFDGVTFLLTYALLGVVLFVGQWMLRAGWYDGHAVSVAAFVIYESVGVVRYLHGHYQLGMEKFTIMFVMMGVGWLAFFLPIGGYGGGGGGGWIGCSGGGGCGGSSSSCGGGGGCGGCGGGD